LTPAHSEVPSKIIHELISRHRKFFNIHELIRQPDQSSSGSSVRPESTTSIPLNTGDHEQNITIQVPSKYTRKLRTVTSLQDYFEAYLSSILPAMNLRVINATSLIEAQSAANEVQNHICFLLSSIVVTRELGFKDGLNYLESHRQECTQSKAPINIAVRDQHKYSNMQGSQLSEKTKQLGASNNNNNSNNNTSARGKSGTIGSSSSSNGSSSNNSNRTHSKPSKYPTKVSDGSCGGFNSFAGCKETNCQYTHVCRLCKSNSHGKTSCPQFKGTKGSAAANNKQ